MFHIKKPKKVIQNSLGPFLRVVDPIMFSIATSMGTKPTNSKIVVYDVGGQAIQSSNPERMESSIFFFIEFVHHVIARDEAISLGQSDFSA